MSVLYTEWSIVSNVGAVYWVVYSLIVRCCIHLGGP